MLSHATEFRAHPEYKRGRSGLQRPRRANIFRGSGSRVVALMQWFMTKEIGSNDFELPQLAT